MNNHLKSCILAGFIGFFGSLILTYYGYIPFLLENSNKETINKNQTKEENIKYDKEKHDFCLSVVQYKRKQNLFSDFIGEECLKVLTLEEIK